MINRTLFLLVTCVSCTGQQKPATWEDFSPEERACIAAEKLKTATELTSCGKNVEGACATKEVYFRELERLKDCVR